MDHQGIPDIVGLDSIARVLCSCPRTAVIEDCYDREPQAPAVLEARVQDGSVAGPAPLRAPRPAPPASSRGHPCTSVS